MRLMQIFPKNQAKFDGLLTSVANATVRYILTCTGGIGLSSCLSCLDTQMMQNTRLYTAQSQMRPKHFFSENKPLFRDFFYIKHKCHRLVGTFLFQSVGGLVAVDSLQDVMKSQPHSEQSQMQPTRNSLSNEVFFLNFLPRAQLRPFGMYSIIVVCK